MLCDRAANRVLSHAVAAPRHPRSDGRVRPRDPRVRGGPARRQPSATQGLEPGLMAAGVGFGIVMPSVIKAVLGGVDQRHAGLASGLVISTLQIGAALGVAIIGGVFYHALGTGQTAGAYAHAFTLSL